MDNTGAYLKYGELLLSMYLAGNSKVKNDTITLTAKETFEDGDVFTFSVAGDLVPKVGDVVSQSGLVAHIKSFPAADKIKIDSSGELENGPSDLLHSDTVPKYHADELIQMASDIIDEKTGQFFNKREGVFKIEGNNTPLMLFPVPIISVDKLLINSTKIELREGEDYDYVVFNGRQRPQDDRRNPRIKLNVGRGRDSIFVRSLTSRIFVKGTLTEITGSFGFLEANGKTPGAIKRAVQLLVMQDINNPIGASASISDKSGPLKRKKVDLHEVEFFESAENKKDVRSSSTGNEEVDRIVAQYRAPIKISGSFRTRSANEDDFYTTERML